MLHIFYCDHDAVNYVARDDDEHQQKMWLDWEKAKKEDSINKTEHSKSWILWVNWMCIMKDIGLEK